jgi:Zn-dependent protease with chaperone function/type II secretory pathway pseudopilin PulG
MDMTQEDLVLKKEKLYFGFLVFFAIIFWIFVFVTLVGPFIALVLAFFGWLANGLFIARLKADCILVTEQQMPELHGTFRAVCEKLGLSKLPELYIVQSQGMLNAFAIRHSGREFVALYSDIVEAYGQNSDEIRFIMGHEVGHIQRKHILKMLFLGPALILPLVGAAYSRACEATCDRFGVFAVNDPNGAVTAMMILSGGKEAGRLMSPEAFSLQHQNHRGFFVSWYELISGYPTLSQRVANIMAIKNNSSEQKVSRHPLSYVFAFFTFGGGSGGGNVMITVAIVAMLAAIAIPNVLRAKISANDHIAEANLNALGTAIVTYSTNHGGKFPADSTGLTNATPPYIQQDVCGKTISGYQYKCELSETDFTLTAMPVTMGTTGTHPFQVTKSDFIADPGAAEKSPDDKPHYMSNGFKEFPEQK